LFGSVSSLGGDGQQGAKTQGGEQRILLHGAILLSDSIYNDRGGNDKGFVAAKKVESTADSFVEKRGFRYHAAP
jgi:hypothetical protein